MKRINGAGYAGNFEKKKKNNCIYYFILKLIFIKLLEKNNIKKKWDFYHGNSLNSDNFRINI